MTETTPAPEAAPAPPARAPEAAAPAAETAAETVAETAAVPRRRKLRAALRWTSAVLIFAALGGVTTYAVTRPERTKIPGLKTPDDGRWTFPPYALPKLPAGKPRPLNAGANPAGHHFVDVRSLLLPAPLTATAERNLPGKSGWLSVDSYLKLYSLAGDLAPFEKTALKDDGLRHIAAEGWTMPDGTRTEVYLLQYISSGHLQLSDVRGADLKGVTTNAPDNSVPSRSVPTDISVSAYAEVKPDAGDTRYAYAVAGDTLALIVQSRTGGPVPEVPFRQTVRLQAQLLG
ncbi:hypothetical protein GA0115240_142514 [Streptomyces sp. DvalAA-14]|uniref:hypothetical protein n=1 Tax=unclassified Streptomyces TaxID=2593676 RepID=UPI00081B50B8|nr:MULTISPECIES: hypothetical protein [unclassified Streptomyces]MYS22613.1 hypothetical protein [Streptomyces sp. SID4948]SCE19255.1 hypothetical protein GA0115240_142514 [Streptomyces sp. DvalAA-14]